MQRESLSSKIKLVYKKHRRFFNSVFIIVGLWITINYTASHFYKPPGGNLLSRETAEAAKRYVLSFGAAAPVVFIALQTLQVVFAPVPGQLIGFIGGYIFGWKRGAIYTALGLSIGSFIVFQLARGLGRGFVEKLHGKEAVKDLEELFLGESEFYEKSKRAISSHGLLTFFLIMLLPGLPDNLACFVAGLTRIPIWQLTIAAVIGRLPGAFVLSLAGDGWSKAENNATLVIFIAAALLLTALYLWKKQKIEAAVRKLVGLSE
jgi:uncharacterized membrane protein YdjX (TVP38/TMEM64 family)